MGIGYVVRHDAMLRNDHYSFYAHVIGEFHGLRADSRMMGVRIVRPLVHARKQQMYSAARRAPFLRDSTPLWSVRGAMRRALDAADPGLPAALAAFRAEAQPRSLMKR